MNTVYNLIGANSNIAIHLYRYLKNESNMINKFTHMDKNMEINFINLSSEENVNIYFSIIKDDLKASIKHLNKYIDLSTKKKSKFFYISSINAKFPNASYYSKIKYECEKIVLKKGGKIIRLGLVKSPKPFGPYKSLQKLARLPFKIKFSNSTKIITTDINNFISINFKNINKTIIEIFDNEYLLNDFLTMHQVKKNKININLNLVVKFLQKLNKVFFLKGIFGRLLTLTCNDS